MAKNPGVTVQLRTVVDERIKPLEDSMAKGFGRVANEMVALAAAVRATPDETQQILRVIRSRADDDERRTAATEERAKEDRKAMEQLSAAIDKLSASVGATAERLKNVLAAR